jgi:lysophospholipase L1-like esterase
MAFTASTVSGLLAWYLTDTTGTSGLPNNGVYTDAGTTLATNGQTVEQWNDQSGNARNMTQATAGLRPVYTTGLLNGLSGVVFNGTAGEYLKNTALAFSDQAVTIFFVYAVNARAIAGTYIGGSIGLLFGCTSTTGCNITLGSNYFNASIADDNLGQLATINLSASSATCRTSYGDQAGAEVTDSMGALGSNTNTGVTMAATFAGATASGVNITIYEALVYNSSLSAGNVTTVEAYLKAKWLVGQTITSSTPVFVMDGDSGPAGSGLTLNSQEFVQVGTSVLQSNTPTLVRNLSSGGATFTTLTARASGYINSIPSVTLTEPALLGISCGHNDLVAGATPASLLATVQTYINNAFAAGWKKVSIATLTPFLNPATYETQRQAYNALIRSTYANNSNVIIADVGNDSSIGYPGAQLNSTYYQADYTHLTAAGNVIAAGYITSAVNQAFGIGIAEILPAQVSVVVPLIGVGTLWSGSPFSVVSGVCTITAQTVTSTTQASITISYGGNGPFVITDGFQTITLTRNIITNTTPGIGGSV